MPILIQDDGSGALLFDDADSDEGTAFTILLEIKQVSQDSFL